jgi:hypothetical protein
MAIIFTSCLSKGSEWLVDLAGGKRKKMSGGEWVVM